MPLRAAVLLFLVLTHLQFMQHMHPCKVSWQCAPPPAPKEFAGLGGAKGIALQKHAKPYSAATHNKLSVVLWHRWGRAAICNKKVMG